MQRLYLLTGFFLLIPVTLFTSAFYLLMLLHNGSSSVLGLSTTNSVAYAALPTSQNTLNQGITETDQRVASLTQFFQSHNSPLVPYAGDFVADADLYGLDYRIVPAIAMQESDLCVKALIQSPYNCYGWGITKHNVTTFSSYEEGIDVVTRSLAAWGLTTPEEIGKRYNPTNTNNWVQNVTTVMNEL